MKNILLAFTFPAISTRTEVTPPRVDGYNVIKADPDVTVSKICRHPSLLLGL